MCGAETDLVRAIIEKVQMNVCPKCAAFGRVLKSPVSKAVSAKNAVEDDIPEVVESIAENYADIVKSAREKTDFKQEDVARRINEKVSVIHQVESGHFKPNIALARKLEKFFHISLVEQITLEKNKKKENHGSEAMTIGDLIKKK